MIENLAVMIPTAEGRQSVLLWNIKHLLMHLPIAFTLYIYNDSGEPISEQVHRTVYDKRDDITVRIFNDHGEISSCKVGAGGTRHVLFEAIKASGHTTVASFDDDMQITAGWYEGIDKAMKAYPQHSVFTTLMRDPQGKPRQAGSAIQFEGIWLIRKPIRQIQAQYQLADWGPLGNLVLCRQALAPQIVIPHELVMSDDIAIFLILRELGINETVCVTSASVIHKPIDSPHVPGFRTLENLKASARYIWHRFGVNVTPNYGYYSPLGVPTGIEEMRRFVE